MAEVVVFHHVQGLTDGVRAFADELRADGHTVHTPDMFGGRTFPTIDDGIAFAQEQGFGKLVGGGVAAADELPAEVVYVGFSFGAMPAQQLAQTKPGARGALLIYGVVPYTEFGDAWPEDVPVQIHAMENDAWFLEDLPSAQALADSTDARRAVPLSRRQAPVRRRLDGRLRRRRGCAAHGARARVPRTRLATSPPASRVPARVDTHTKPAICSP